MLEGHTRDLTQAIRELALQPPTCGWDNYGMSEPCGEPAYHHFKWTLGKYDRESGNHEIHYRWLCNKHDAQDEAESEAAGDACHEMMDWQELLDAARRADTKEEVVELLTAATRRAEAMHSAYCEYARRAGELEGPGTIVELDEIYRETIHKARILDYPGEVDDIGD